MPRPRALTILAGGGFSFETRCLLQQLAADLDLAYLATEFGGTPGEGGLPPGAAYPVPSFATVTRPSRLQSLRAFRATFLATLRVIRRHDPQAVIAIGCSHAVPMFLAARLLGRRTVFLESITRVDRLSATGHLVYRLRLASLFLIQWPRLQQAYPASRLGTIL